MIVYSATLGDFQRDILTNNIGNIIHATYKEKTGKSTSKKEIQTWQNSLQYMENVLQDADISPDVLISVEYHIPTTCKRIDFIISGRNENHEDVAIIIELKQWTEAVLSESDGIIKTYFSGGLQETTHPSYQVLSYKELLDNFNTVVEEEDIKLIPCVYLHNYDPDGIIDNQCYQSYLSQAPIFLKPDALRLRNFITHHVRYADVNKVMYRIDQGRIKPSKNLVDKLNSMLKGNKEFVLIDDQKIVYEQALKLAQKAQEGQKEILIVQGGPGTGKSVVAINLLIELNKRELVTHYVTRSAAPRNVYEAKLKGSFTKDYISNLFKNSGAYYSVLDNDLNALVIDEAHRLAERGLYGKGENQIKEIIQASRFSVFFIDEDQTVDFKDIGTVDSILGWAQKFEANCSILDLKSQFRCNGSDGYIAWLKNVLQIRPTANLSITELGYDFQVIDSPAQLHDLIKSKNINNKARVVAGFCWDWQSKDKPHLKDIVIQDYQATWNFNKERATWIIQPNSVSEIGCIHTCQGLEADYIGVIIGDDLVVRNGQIITRPEYRSKDDRTLWGWKTKMKEDPALTMARVEAIIKNTYLVLMTRGQKGCYIYCADEETQRYFKNLLQSL